MAMPNYLKGVTIERVWRVAVASVALAPQGLKEQRVECAATPMWQLKNGLQQALKACTIRMDGTASAM